MFLILLLAFDQPVPPECVIDQCDANFCLVDTPEGIVGIPRRRHYKEGTPVECPIDLIEPT
jgi:hypothetical protein